MQTHFGKGRQALICFRLNELKFMQNHNSVFFALDQPAGDGGLSFLNLYPQWMSKFSLLL
jgi:hypothetical protein